MARIMLDVCLALVLLIWALYAAAFISNAAKAQTPGCFPAVIVDVKDGDTVSVFYGTSEEMVWVHVNLRIHGIDTPEKARSRLPGKTYPAKCPAEAAKGLSATHYLKQRLKPFMGIKGNPERSMVRVCAPGKDKYYGRRVGRLQFRTSKGWQDVGNMMIEGGLAFPYDGGRKSSWCACLEKGTCPPGYKGTT